MSAEAVRPFCLRYIGGLQTVHIFCAYGHCIIRVPHNPIVSHAIAFTYRLALYDDHIGCQSMYTLTFHALTIPPHRDWLAIASHTQPLLSTFLHIYYYTLAEGACASENLLYVML